MTKLNLRSYVEQKDKWPRGGRHLLAQFDSGSVVIYQAFREAIGRFAVEHGHFGGEFSFDRVSWIKPSFLWMMSRSSWGTKPGQEKILAVWLERSAFDEILGQAAPADSAGATPSPISKAETGISQPRVIFQWEPDRDPLGNKLDRRTIQLGLRGDTLRLYAQDWLAGIEDITDVVREVRKSAASIDFGQLSTPAEEPYPVEDPVVRARLGLSPI